MHARLGWGRVRISIVGARLDAKLYVELTLDSAFANHAKVPEKGLDGHVRFGGKTSRSKIASCLELSNDGIQTLHYGNW